MKFNDIIRAAMKETGTRQQDLGKKLGLKQNSISNTITRTNITLNKFAIVMDTLGYEIVIQPRDGKGDKMVLTGEDK